MRHRLAEKACGVGDVAARVGSEPVRHRHDAIGPGLAFERLGAFGAVFQARQHLGHGALVTRAGESVEILQVEEGREVLVQARLQVDRDVAPAVADIDAAQFETRQQ